MGSWRPPPPRPGEVTAREAARVLGVSASSTVYKWFREGRLAGRRTASGFVFLDRDSVELHKTLSNA